MSSFSGLHWVILTLIAYVIIRVLFDRKGEAKYCKTCGHTGKTESYTPGNFFIELVLWLCLIVPGLIYSIWRLSGRTRKCEKCGGKELVPTDSPVAIAAQTRVNS